MSSVDPLDSAAWITGQSPISQPSPSLPGASVHLLQSLVRVNQLLLTEKHLPTAIPQALAVVGQAIAADRVYLCQYQTQSETAITIRLSYEWCRVATLGPPLRTLWQTLSTACQDFQPWLAAFSQHQLVCGPTTAFAPPLAHRLASSQTQSLLLVPVFVAEHLWGHVGFDACGGERAWSLLEQTLGWGIAGTLGAAIAQHHRLAELETHKRRFQKLAQNLPGVLFQMDLEPAGTLSFSYLSAGCQDLFGLPPEVARDQILTTLTHPGDRQRVHEHFLASAQTRQRLELEWRCVTPQGQVQWLQASAMPELLANGQVRWHGVLFDVSDRKAAAAQLQEQESFLRSIYDGVAHRIFVLQVAPDGRVAYSGHNRAAEYATGRTSASVENISPTEMFGAAEGAAIEAICQQCIASEQAITQEEHLTLNGKASWVLTTFTPLKDATGRVHRIIGTSFDITPMKQAQAELKQQACLSAFRSEIDTLLTRGEALQVMLQSCCNVMTRALNVAFTGIWTHPEAAPYLDLQAHAGPCAPMAAVGTRVYLEQSTLGMIVAQKLAYFTQDVPHDPHILVREWADQQGLVAFAGYPLIVDEQVLGVMALFAHQPLSQPVLQTLGLVADEIALGIKRKQTEVQLYRSEKQLRQQAQELQTMLQELQRTQSHLVQSEKMSSLGQLVAGVAHEINNPVNFIYGNLAHARHYTEDLLNLVHLFQTHYPAPHQEIQAAMATMDLDFVLADLPKLLHSMKVGAERIQGIVSSLRTFSRMDEADMKAVNLHDGLESTLLILQNRLKARPPLQEIQIRRQYGDLPLVECYPGQLNQVFMNILSNAIDALEDVRAGTVSDKPEAWIAIATTLKAHQVKIQIQDNGPGIAAHHLSRLFDPFFTTKPIGKGTGMGLSISYQIVTEKHRGQLTCKSVVGRGTTFNIAIPLKQS